MPLFSSSQGRASRRRSLKRKTSAASSTTRSRSRSRRVPVPPLDEDGADESPAVQGQDADEERPRLKERKYSFYTLDNMQKIRQELGDVGAWVDNPILERSSTPLPSLEVPPLAAQLSRGSSGRSSRSRDAAVSTSRRWGFFPLRGPKPSAPRKEKEKESKRMAAQRRLTPLVIDDALFAASGEQAATGAQRRPTKRQTNNDGVFTEEFSRANTPTRLSRRFDEGGSLPLGSQVPPAGASEEKRREYLLLGPVGKRSTDAATPAAAITIDPVGTTPKDEAVDSDDDWTELPLSPAHAAEYAAMSARREKRRLSEPRKLVKNPASAAAAVLPSSSSSPAGKRRRKRASEGGATWRERMGSFGS